MYVNDDTTAGDAVATACKEFSIIDNTEDHALYRITVQPETSFVKQSKLPDAWSKLADIPLGSRYYLKNTMNSDQLLPDENIPDLIKEANFSFLDLNCFEVALYLTREDYKLFQMTEPTNFIDDLFHGDTELLHFKQFEDLVNRELFWVVTTICNEPSALQRSKIIKHFIKIAHHCKVLKNFNSTFALVSGLGYRAVCRLKQTWEKVPAKSVRLFKELQALMDPSRNMSKYRTLLSDFIHQPPVIPYIPVVKKDLTFLHLGNDTKVNGLINFEKMRMIAREVRNVCRLCAPDKSQIIPSAVASQQKEPDKGTIYQTLVRRGRRASFNNVRRIYEDQLNVRRVRQYMKQLNIISDEEKLMDMSKQVEPQAAPSSGQTKRRNTSTTLTSSSPSRSSKTLPNQPGRNSSSAPTNTLQTRNNSEPHLANIPGISIQPVRKKTMSSTLPKYGSDLQSPQLISRKLMSLSEESGAEEKRNRGKKMKDSKRSASVSSHDLSPTSSPYSTPKHQDATNLLSNHTVASENANKNNNRNSLSFVPPHDDLSHPSLATYSASRKSLPPHMNASCRSSFASTSSLGTMSSSNPSTSSLGNGSSPRSSSPTSWGSSTSLPHAIQSGSKSSQHSNSPSRSASGSSADTVKSAVGLLPHHERPVIKAARNSRSGSYGGANNASINERVLLQMTASSSSPTLNASRTQQSALILPNHPRIPRTPSIDSGVLSAGSLSVDSVRYNPLEENDMVLRAHPHYSLQNALPKRSTVVRTPDGSSSSNRRSQHVRSVSADQPAVAKSNTRTPESRTEEDNGEKMEQTFLFGCRGPWDTPRPDNKVPISLPLFGAVNPAEYDDKLTSNLNFHPGHIPPGVKAPPQVRHPGGRNVAGKGVVKNIHEFVMCERQAAKHSRSLYRNSGHYGHNPVMQPYFIDSIRTATSEDLLEEQLVLELRQQKPKYHNTKRLLHFSPTDNATNLENLKRLSLNQSVQIVDDVTRWPNYPPSRHHVTPDRGYLPNDHPSPTYFQLHPHHQFRTSPQLARPTSLTNSPQSYRGLNSTEASAIAAYDALQQNNGWPQDGDKLPSRNPVRNCEVSGRTFQNSVVLSPQEQYYCESHKRPSGFHPSSPMTNGPADSYEQFVNDPNTLLHYPASQLPMHPSEVQSPDLAHRVPQEDKDRPQEKSYVFHPRRKSQEWNETDLDGEKQQQTIRTWSSSASLSSVSFASQISSSNSHPERLTPSETKSTKPPAPPPPLRTSSRNPVKINDASQPLPFSKPEPTEEGGVRQSSTRPDELVVKTNGHLLNGLVGITTHSSNPQLDRRSLPSYHEALQQINAKHSFPLRSPGKTSLRNMNAEKLESNEQISQV